MKQMKQKKQKKWLLPSVALVMLLVLVSLVVFGIIPLLNTPEDENISEQYAKLEEKYDAITYNEKTGSLFVNNEVIVMVNMGTSKEQVEGLAKSVKANIANGMEDLGIYKFIFANSMTAKKIDETIDTIKENSIVTDAYMNTAFIADDEAIVEEVKKVDPVYPNDPWDDDEWDMLVPRGENWGMEAIHAPAAWGYLSQLAEVKVGLIDSVIDVTHEDLSVIAKIALTKIDNEIEEGTERFLTKTITADYGSFSFHGTHVGGTIAANWNDKGVTGVMGNKGKLYYSAAYNTLDDKIVNEYYTAYNYFQAIKILLDQGVQAINISQNTSRLISYAASRGNDNAIAHLRKQADILEAMLTRTIDDIERNNKPDFVICVAAGNANDLYYVEDEDETYGYREYNGWFFDKKESGDVEARFNNFISLIDDEKVMDRVIVVGSVGIDYEHSTDEETRYRYSSFSDIGDRVDVAAPGEDIYSASTRKGGYESLSGTSMATPHVTGVAGLIFAANPKLSGPEVKQIILASTYDRFIYTGGACGLIDAELAVINALQTVDHSIKEVISSTVSTGLDLCFIVDTTGSMGDDIDNARANMNRIIAELEEKGTSYRVALVDYRDFSSRTGNSNDYPAKVQLNFTSDSDAIVAAINGLTLGYGGDEKETVYSGIAECLKLDWDEGSKKIIMIIGDAAPLDPEPETGYTYEKIIEALYNADIIVDDEDEELVSDASIDMSSADISLVFATADMVSEDSYVKADMDTYLTADTTSDDKDEEEEENQYDIGPGKNSAINVYTIDTGTSSKAESFFKDISSHTGGQFADITDSSQVADAIISHIEAVELNALMNVNAEFGSHLSNEWVEIYKNGEYVFSFELNDEGEKKLYGIEPDIYEWKIDRLAKSGEMTIANNKKAADIEENDDPWYGFALNIWYRNTMILLAVATALVLAVVCTSMISTKMKRKRSAVAVMQQPMQQPIQQPIQQPVDHIMQSNEEK